MLGKTLLSQLIQLNVGKILALCCENYCLAAECHQLRLQCIGAKKFTKTNAVQLHRVLAKIRRK